MATTNHTIPSGYSFRPEVGADSFLMWLAENQIDPSKINGNADVVIVSTKTTKGVTWALTASTTHGDTGTWPLMKLPTVTVTNWLQQFAPKPVDVSEIRSMLDKLDAARKREKVAHDEAEEARAEVMAYLHSRGATVGTIDGQPYVRINPVPMPGKFNRKGFEKEYPEIAERFTGNDYDQNRVELL